MTLTTQTVLQATRLLMASLHMAILWQFPSLREEEAYPIIASAVQHAALSPMYDRLFDMFRRRYTEEDRTYEAAISCLRQQEYVDYGISADVIAVLVTDESPDSPMRSELMEALEALRAIPVQSSPMEKVSLIVDACHAICKIQTKDGGPIGADGLVPLLLWCTAQVLAAANLTIQELCNSKLI